MVLWGGMQLTNYIIAFNYSKICLLELSKLTNKKIVAVFEFNLDDVEYIKSKDIVFGKAKKIKLKFKNGNAYNFQCNKKLIGFENQLSSLEKFIQLF